MGRGRRSGAREGQVDDLVLELARQATSPNQQEIVEDPSRVHASRELDDAGNVPTRGKVVAEMDRHSGSIVRDQWYNHP
jgi:hypothetical protein